MEENSSVLSRFIRVLLTGAPKRSLQILQFFYTTFILGALFRSGIGILVSNNFLNS